MNENTNKGKNKEDWHPTLSNDAIAFTSTEIMLKLISTIDDMGYPHVTLIISNHAVNNHEIKWGQFSQGKSKKHVTARPKIGLFYMTTEMPFKYLQVKASHSRVSTDGLDAESFNKQALLRYNTYLRVYKTYFNDVVEATNVKNLSIGGILKSAITMSMTKKNTRQEQEDIRLPSFGMKLVNGAFTPKFLSFIDPADGYPVIVPCFQARAKNSAILIFDLSQSRNYLENLSNGMKIALFALSKELESILVKGTFTGFKKKTGRRFGEILIEKVYNPMPPIPGSIYPEKYEREKILSFPE
ncbi:MAG: hypothetical protein ACTSVI_12500 [Promethearchaeota archaeon]